MSVLAKLLRHLVSRSEAPITEADYQAAVEEIVAGSVPEAVTAAFLAAQALSPVTAEALVGAVRVLRAHVKPVDLPTGIKGALVDTCGTGGDGRNTFNISTTAAFVAAAAGARIAKHGNRSSSSQSGSADFLEALRVPLDLDPAQSLERSGFAFLYAPLYHNAMGKVARIRETLGFRTLFNLIGPLANPAAASFQVLGVYDEELLEPMAKALQRLGIERAWVVHGEDGMDEISMTAPTQVVEVTQEGQRIFRLEPQAIGLSLCKPEDLRGADAETNVRISEGIFSGEKGPRRDCVVLNAAAALVVSGVATDLRQGVKMAAQAIDSGKALAGVNVLRSMHRG